MLASVLRRCPRSPSEPWSLGPYSGGDPSQTAAGDVEARPDRAGEAASHLPRVPSEQAFGAPADSGLVEAVLSGSAASPALERASRHDLDLPSWTELSSDPRRR